MAATMVQRGPDGGGTWSDDAAGLAFRRLAIIDLHERSGQPMHLGPLHLVFNGEIYNYRELRERLRSAGHQFVTAGDGEVLLHAWAEWGEAALEAFNGMFAFAVWDETTRELTVASDPFGEKPVYYSIAQDGRLVFASRLQAILLDEGVDGGEDEETLAAYVTHGVMPPPARTFFRRISRLPAAHLLRWRDGAVDVRRYWHPAPVAVPTDYAAAVRELRAMLADSVRLRLRSDVPVGTSLSGGVDSSAIVMLAAALAGEHRRHAFTARFRDHALDEWPYAEQVARAARVEHHHSVEPGPEDVARDVHALVADHEEPLGTLSVYAQWRINQAARSTGIVVLLDGQGGDELFGGYGVAPGMALRSMDGGGLARDLARRAPAGVRALADSLARDHLPTPLRLAIHRRRASPYAAGDLAARPALGERPAVEAWARDGTPLHRELLAEAFFTTLPALLRYADRSSMAHSVEVRLPLLDRRIAEFAFSLPASFLYRQGLRKAILRDAVRDVVPADILRRRDKIGFDPPQARWLADPAVQSLMGEVLLDARARRRGVYDTGAIEADLGRGEWRDPVAIWRAFNAELWFGALVDGRPRAHATAPRMPA